MITLTYHQLILFALLIVFSYFSYKQIKSVLLFFKIRKGYKDFFKEKDKEIAKMKEEGRLHDWVTLPVNIPGKGIIDTTVCKETGYCPSVDGFVDKMQVRHMVEMKRLNEEFDSFRKNRVSELAEKWNTSEDVFGNIIDDIYSIKKDFHVQKMEQSMKELKEQLGDNVKFVSSPEELEEILKEKKDESVH